MLMRVEEIAIGQTRMAMRPGTARAAPRYLIDHEFAVVFADGALCGCEPGIGRIRALCPFPDIGHHLQRACRVLGAGRHRAQEPALQPVGRLVAFGSAAQRPGRDFPFRLGRQAPSRPGSIGGSLVKADMTDGRVVIERAVAGKGEFVPGSVIRLAPVERGIPAFFVYQRPSIGVSEPGILVAAILDKRQKFAVRDRAGSDREIANHDVMRRAFIVER